MYSEQLKYYIALTFIPGVGDIIAKNLIAYIGSAEGIFKEKKQNLLKIPKIGETLAECITSSETIKRAETELLFIEKNNIKAFAYTDDNYPTRLKLCDDSPVVLYIKGNCNFNAPKSIAIVGTRNATAYGKDICKQLIEDLKPHNCIIVSGLAYGIDICAHKLALDNNLETLGIMGHALDTMYPADHKAYAKMIAEHGALITEHPSKTPIDKSNFVKRNRIIAGLSDATIVIESGEKGGALITTEYANAYNRDVFAIPGRTSDKYSVGCNNLIRTNKAALVTSVKDIEYILNWQNSSSKKVIQKSLFVDLSPDDELIMKILEKEQDVNIDIICTRSNLQMNKVSAILLNLEFNGLVKTMPGKRFCLA